MFIILLGAHAFVKTVETLKAFTCLSLTTLFLGFNSWVRRLLYSQSCIGAAYLPFTLDDSR